MVTNRLGKKSVKKMILTATAVIGTSTLLFMGFLQAVTEAEYKKTNTIPTDLRKLHRIQWKQHKTVYQKVTRKQIIK